MDGPHRRHRRRSHSWHDPGPWQPPHRRGRAGDAERRDRFDSDNGGYNIVVISGGTVRVSEASCPDQVCVRKGATDQTNDPIACLPNKLVVQVVGGGEQNNQLDGVS